MQSQEWHTGQDHLGTLPGRASLVEDTAAVEQQTAAFLTLALTSEGFAVQLGRQQSVEEVEPKLLEVGHWDTLEEAGWSQDMVDRAHQGKGSFLVDTLHRQQQTGVVLGMY